jgi:protein-S-isoprenylcysteine O-methyltransferase Ste14
MRKPAAAAVSFAWGVAVGGTSGCVLPYLLGDWHGFYRYVRNPIYVGFLAVLIGDVLLFGSPGLLEYTAVAWGIGATAVRFYEEPTLARKFGADYQDYRHAVRAWVARLHPWTPR